MIDRPRALHQATRRRGSPPPRDHAADVVTVVNGIRRLERGLRLAAHQVSAVARLSAAQLFILEQLADAPAESLNHLAARTLTDRSSVSALVDRLAALGLVERSPDVDDRRRHRLRITAAGRARLASAPSPPTARLIAALEHLTPRELLGLARGLTRLNEVLGLSTQRAHLLFEDDEAEVHG